ncbi:MAG: cytochrome C [Alphaproteobacteria bacterium]|uniref:Cytochrome C n=1 Tax=Candidatus Nitrobium versatile TaxID=2884831 RepID=A0A953J255_9BACT|nr:cytochrome C [Candidatus Nitrobium versatile]
MKKIELIFGIIIALGMTAWFPCRVSAFHDGGVAYCDGCHTMHNSSGGAVMNARSGQGSQTIGTANGYLLQGSDQSSTCLKCHSGSTAGSYKIATYPVPGAGSPPLQLTPGGDFAWLQKSYSWTTSYGASGSSPGERHGHNIVAADFGFVADATLTAAPGGSYPAASLSCVSCHDPHGKYRINSNPATSFATSGKPIAGSGSYGDLPTASEAVGVYRLLGGKLYQPKSVNYAFTYDPPVAVAPSTYNRAEDTTDTRVVYGKGTTEWCANCHELFHSNLGSGLVHPAGVSVYSTIASNYNMYVKTGSTGGVKGTAYTSMVPFQVDNTNDISTLSGKTSSTAGMETNDRVTCLTCHRAHASGWDSMTRWNNKAEFLTIAGEYPGTDATDPEGAYGQYHGGKTKAEVAKTFYDRPAGKYASYQRSLCNKCHIKD